MKSKFFKNIIQILIFSSTILTQFGCDKTEENKLLTCVITSPGDSVEIVQGETVTIYVNAKDIDGSISKVRFSVDGSDIGSTSSSPYNFDWETSDYEIGSHSIEAVAENNSGSFASHEIEIILIPEIVTDSDGNIYNIIKIGDQIWMTENLKTTKYDDGTDIPLVTDNIEWIGLRTPGYCWYNNDEATFKDTYGAMYNWYTVDTDKLCPDGWHVPGDTEWQTLIDHLGGEDAGGKLKEAGTTHWNSPNTGATNESGFTGLPGGYRYSLSGSFRYLGSIGYIWSATEVYSLYAWHRELYYYYADVSRYYYHKSNGLSVRCLKDN